jgi:hypothetical protein
MIVTIDPGKRPGGDLGVDRGRPEKGFRIVGSGGDAAAGEEAVGETSARADHGSVPDDGPRERGIRPDPAAAEDAVGGHEPVRSVEGEDARCAIEGPAPGGKGSAARERFERRAEEIARAAEVGVRAMMADEAKLFTPLVEQRLPEVPNEGGLSGGDAAQEPRGKDADAGIEQRPWSVDPEARDAVPFGLKRRVQIRVPVVGDEERRGSPRVTVSADQAGVVGRDGGVGVDDEEVVAARVQKRGRVAERAGSAQDLWLVEKRELRKVRRLLAQVALDLVREVMQINRYFAEAGLVEAAQVRARERDVQKR